MKLADNVVDLYKLTDKELNDLITKYSRFVDPYGRDMWRALTQECWERLKLRYDEYFALPENMPTKLWEVDR